MRVAVTGSTGRLGTALVEAARRSGHEVLGLARTEAEPCDLTDRRAIAVRLGGWEPEVVIHAAGWADVDGCERDPERAHELNVDMTADVAAVAAAVDAHLVFVSTNHVFDGEADRPYREDDPTSPRSAYGATKLAAEELLDPSATIVRTAWLSIRDGGGVLGSILAAADAPGPLRFVDDEVAQPTFAFDLAPVLVRLGEDRHAGLVHATNEGAVSSFELAQEVLAAIGEDPERVLAITADALPGRIAPRPRNGALDTGVLRASAFGALPDHRTSLEAVLRELRPRP